MATSLYETDLYAWSQQQVALLRAEDFAEVDWPNVIEEIDSLGASQRNELRNRLKILLLHLLKGQFQHARRSKSWRASIDEQRGSIDDLLGDNPSLRSVLSESVIVAYPRAVRDACKQTGLLRQNLPLECPYMLEQILDEDFYPAPNAPTLVIDGW